MKPISIAKPSTLLSLLLFALAWVVPGPATAADDITSMLSNAKTAADDEAIAAYYDKQAAGAKENAELHTRMLAIVKQQDGPGIAKWHMDTHCEGLIRQYKAAAKMYAEMAHAYREMAKMMK